MWYRKFYEPSNHLDNVLVVVTGYKRLVTEEIASSGTPTDVNVYLPSAVSSEEYFARSLQFNV